jgi:hypothetical protein
MADIDVQRKTGMGWLWWLLGLIVLALLAWWLLAPDAEEDLAVVEPVAEEPMITPATTPEIVGTAAGVSIADILGNPAAHEGTDFTDEVTVAEVPTDRGFWIEDQGARMFALIIDDPAEEPKDINPGQTLRIDQGTLRDRTFLPDLQGAPLDAQTQQIVDEQPIFLVVDERYINILEQGTPQPGTDPAATAPGTGN